MAQPPKNICAKGGPLMRKRQKSAKCKFSSLLSFHSRVIRTHAAVVCGGKTVQVSIPHLSS